MAGLRIIVAAGGTGGHLWPAISLARAIGRLAPEADFLFIGAGRPLEARMLEPTGFKYRILKSSGLKGRSLADRARALGRCLTATWEAVGLMRQYRPDLCFGAGGYVTVPVGLAARLTGVPLVIHEQNSRPGLSNKVLGRLAKKIMVGFEEAAASFPAGRTLVTGNPVRPEIAALHDRAAADRDPDRAGSLVVGVTGGSQGAAGLNRAVAPALVKLHREGLPLSVVHQAGGADRQWVETLYREAGLTARVTDFIEDMPGFYAGADLVVGRAGAITIAELTAARRPSILVPLPTAADDHQTANARHLEAAGAALVMPERSLTPENLAGTLGELLKDPARLAAMSRAAADQARLGADEAMARACLDVVRQYKLQ